MEEEMHVRGTPKTFKPWQLTDLIDFLFGQLEEAPDGIRAHVSSRAGSTMLVVATQDWSKDDLRHAVGADPVLLFGKEDITVTLETV